MRTGLGFLGCGYLPGQYLTSDSMDSIYGMKELVGIRRISDSSSSNARGVGGLPGAVVPSGPRLGLVLTNVASLILVDSFLGWQTYTAMFAIH